MNRMRYPWAWRSNDRGDSGCCDIVTRKLCSSDGVFHDCRFVKKMEFGRKDGDIATVYLFRDTSSHLRQCHVREEQEKDGRTFVEPAVVQIHEDDLSIHHWCEVEEFAILGEESAQRGIGEKCTDPVV